MPSLVRRCQSKNRCSIEYGGLPESAMLFDCLFWRFRLGSCGSWAHNDSRHDNLPERKPERSGVTIGWRPTYERRSRTTSEDMSVPAIWWPAWLVNAMPRFHTSGGGNIESLRVNRANATGGRCKSGNLVEAHIILADSTPWHRELCFFCGDDHGYCERCQKLPDAI